MVYCSLRLYLWIVQCFSEEERTIYIYRSTIYIYILKQIDDGVLISKGLWNVTIPSQSQQWHSKATGYNRFCSTKHRQNVQRILLHYISIATERVIISQKHVKRWHKARKIVTNGGTLWFLQGFSDTYTHKYNILIYIHTHKYNIIPIQTYIYIYI